MDMVTVTIKHETLRDCQVWIEGKQFPIDSDGVIRGAGVEQAAQLRDVPGYEVTSKKGAEGSVATPASPVGDPAPPVPSAPITFNGGADDVLAEALKDDEAPDSAQNDTPAPAPATEPKAKRPRKPRKDGESRSRKKK